MKGLIIMKRTIGIILVILMTAAFITGCSDASGTTEPVQQSIPAEMAGTAETGFGAAGSFSNPNSDIEQMLIYAIQDEYLARAEYEYLINDLGAGNPFLNIIKAEEKHISMLIPLFEKYEYTVPEDTSGDHIIQVTSITEALEAGVKAEEDNIAMYENFLMNELPEDISAIFTELRDASVNHLAAFKRKLSR